LIAPYVIGCGAGIKATGLVSEGRARRSGIRNGPHAEEEDIQDSDCVGQLDRAVVVRVGRIHAIKLARPQEQEVEDSHRIGQLEGAVIVRISSVEKGPAPGCLAAQDGRPVAVTLLEDEKLKVELVGGSGVVQGYRVAAAVKRGQRNVIRLLMEINVYERGGIG